MAYIHYFNTTLDQVVDTTSEYIVKAYAEIEEDGEVRPPDILTINGRVPSKTRAMQIDEDALYAIALDTWTQQLDLWKAQAEEAGYV